MIENRSSAAFQCVFLFPQSCRSLTRHFRDRNKLAACAIVLSRTRYGLSPRPRPGKHAKEKQCPEMPVSK